MRILFHSRYPHDENNPRGGVESATLNLLAGLKSLGYHDLHVVTLEKGLKQATIEDRELATVHRLPAGPWPMIIDIFGGPGRALLKSCILDVDPDIIHFHETHGLGSASWPRPSVFTVHGFDSLNLPTEKSKGWRIRSKAWGLAERVGLGRQKYLISIAKYVSEEIRTHTKAKIFDIPNAIKASGFDLERTEDAERIFYAGWINARKNALGLIEAFAVALSTCPSAKLRLAGEFSDLNYKVKVIARIQQLQLEDKVTLLGRISADEMRREFQSASVFVLPSFQENAPMVISEAMAAGVPVVSSNVCGMPDMISHGETGFLFAPDDYNGFGSCIASLLQDGQLREKIAGQARDAAIKAYHPKSVASKTVEVYEHVIANSRSVKKS